MRYFRNSILVMILILNFFGFIAIGECREVVFVLNLGQSMNKSDPFHMAHEGIIRSAQNFSINYSGQSNAGAGLLTAIDMLSPKFNELRDIVFITDGEIKDAQSEENFKAGLKQAQWLKIPVYLVNLRHDVNPQNYRDYNTVIYLPINYNELLTTLRTILQGDFRTPHISLPTNNLMNGTLSFKVPVTSADNVKISLFSTKSGKAHLQNIQPAKDFQGNYVKIFDVNQPKSEEIEIAVDYPQESGLTLDVVPKVSGTLQINSSVNFFCDVLKITPVYKDTGEKI